MDLGPESATYATTLLKFRRLLENNKLSASIFEAINKHLDGIEKLKSKSNGTERYL
jgi:hypothetical protein